MDKHEAEQWLLGKRSCCNYIEGEDKITIKNSLEQKKNLYLDLQHFLQILH